jgi:ribonucleoside-diphosphate reductase alpha chain
VEPELALVKHKQLVGGGSLRIVNRALQLALASLGYGEAEAQALVGHAEAHGSLEGAPGFDPAHLPVFDCALPAGPAGRRIAPRGHLRMLAALQPLISGGISKTINLPSEATVEAIEEVLLDGWRLGLKSVTVYRDGCKGSQPVTTWREEPKSARDPGARDQGARDQGGRAATAAPPAAAPAVGPARPARRRLPDERRALTHKFSIQGHEGYVTAGLYDDGQPGEIFLVMAKEGSTISGLMDALATAVSMALQYGVPLSALVEKFSHTRFEPSGFTKNPEIPFAKSLTDYLFRWLGSRFLPPAERAALGVIERGGADRNGVERNGDLHPPAGPAPPPASAFALDQRDAPACHVCGTLMTRSGTCYRCGNCGSTSGCS